MMNDPGTSDSWKQYLLRQRGKGLGTVLQNPVRVMGVEEGLLNRSCGRRGSIAGDKWYWFSVSFYCCFSADSSFEKSSFTCTGFQPCLASWGEVLDSEHFFSKRWGAHTVCVLRDDRFLFQSCPQLSVSQTPRVVWAKEGKGAPGQSPLVSCHPPAPWDWCTRLGWSGSYSGPSLGKKSYSLQCLSIVVGFETLVPRYTGQRCLESFSAIGS